MAYRRPMLAAALLIGGCGGDGAETGSLAVALPAPTPSPTPPPSPTSTPSPTPTPTPSPPATATYLTFAEVYTNRVGRDLLLASACSGFVQSPTPDVLPVTPWGRGLSLRFVITPQVWAIGGDGVAVTMDGRLADVPTGTEEVAYREVTATHVNRFAIQRPVAAGIGLTYARLATVATRVGASDRHYACLTGIPTLSGDLPLSASGGYPRRVVAGEARLTGAASPTSYALANSSVAITTDLAGRSVTIAVTLVGTPAGGGPDVALGSFTATGPIDPATGEFTAAMTGTDRAADALVSGRVFGPQGVEIGGIVGGRVAASGSRPGYVVAGAVFGAR